MKKVYPRIHILFAREAPTAVILRRGPSDWRRQYLWNTKTDDITPGQWLKHRVYEDRCDLSPNGQLLVYFTLTGKPQSEFCRAWTAVARPPYFTPLAVWPGATTYGGGGHFLNDRELELCGYENSQPTPTAPCPLSTCFTNLTFYIRPQSLGDYRFAPDPSITLPPNLAKARLDHRNRLIFVRDGNLFAIKRPHETSPEAQLYSFNDDRPEEIASPSWARSWPRQKPGITPG